MKDKAKNLGRNVRFNLKIANYRPGQIVRYGDMPDGHRFWVDNKSILGAGRICEFTDEKPVAEKPDPVKPDDSAIIAEAKETILGLREENNTLLYRVDEQKKENEKLIERIIELELSESDLKDKLAELNKVAADPNSGQDNKIPDFTTNDGKKHDPETETKRGRGRPSTKTNENK